MIKHLSESIPFNDPFLSLLNEKGILLSGVPPPVTLTTDLFTRSVTLTSFPTTNAVDLNPESWTNVFEFNGYSIVNCAAPTQTL